MYCIIRKKKAARGFWRRRRLKCCNRRGNDAPPQTRPLKASHLQGDRPGTDPAPDDLVDEAGWNGCAVSPCDFRLWRLVCGSVRQYRAEGDGGAGHDAQYPLNGVAIDALGVDGPRLYRVV
ncbi:hypothetical protein PSTG_19741, partial [Puccinia striiformis f. sp. tritici PST-78]